MRSDTAYAKINLTLHVRRRRNDGYHELETLFAFLDDGDALSIAQADSFALEECGPFGGQAGPPEANLITRAARLTGAGALPSLRITLEKRLPVAAGLGGGSADAAATLRLLGAHDRLDFAASLGADVPACMASVPVIGTGTGTELTPVTNDVQGLACLIVNPLVPLPTGPVFAAWDGVDRGPIAEGSASQIMREGRNDLEAAAIAICPVVGVVLTSLHQTNPLIARMSGSGASCFAVYNEFEAAEAAQTRIRSRTGSTWWTMLGRLR